MRESNVTGSGYKLRLEPSLLDKLKELIKDKQEAREETSQEGKTESRIDSFPLSDIDETEEMKENISQYPSYDQEVLQGVLGTVLEAENKARKPDVIEEPLENRELPEDEIEQEVTGTETAEQVKEDETKENIETGKKKKKQRGGKKKGKKKKRKNSNRTQQSKTKCLKQRQVRSQESHDYFISF